MHRLPPRTASLPLLALCACEPPISPTVTLLAPVADGPVLEGTVIEARARATDGDDPSPSLAARWWVNDTLRCEGPVGADASTTCDFTMPGVATTVRVEATDPDGLSAIAEAALGARPWGEPALLWVQPRQGYPAYLDRPQPIEAWVAHPNQGPATLGLAWRLNDGPNTALRANSEGFASGELGAGLGAHTARLTVTDSRALSIEEERSFTVFATNTAPRCAFTSPAPGASLDTNFALFSAQVEDDELPVRELVVRWFSDVDGNLGRSTPNAGGEAVFHASFLTLGPQRVRLLVTDDVEAACEAEIEVIIVAPEEAEG